MSDDPELSPPSPYPTVQWFPGHIAKARRELRERLAVIDFVLELADARIPLSSRFSQTAELVGTKPILLVLTKADLADPARTRAWVKAYRGVGLPVVAVDARRGEGMKALHAEIATLQQVVQARMRARGRLARAARIMVVGLPNVGKSSLINRLTGGGRAKTGDKPGITRAAAWIRLGKDLELLDTPGIIPPKLEDPIVALKLAMIGGVGSEAYDPVEVARFAFPLLGELAPETVAPFGPEPSIESYGRARGALKQGDRVDPERAARSFLHALRGGDLGPMTLDWPPAL